MNEQDVAAAEGDAALSAAFSRLNMESVEPGASDQALENRGFSSVIDVTLYTPVVTGKAKRASFALLHKIEARSLGAKYEPRTWYREHVSTRKPVEFWFADNGAAIAQQMLLLQVTLLRDFIELLGDQRHPQ